jgi:hypothetical protein
MFNKSLTPLIACVISISIALIVLAVILGFSTRPAQLRYADSKESCTNLCRKHSSRCVNSAQWAVTTKTKFRQADLNVISTSTDTSTDTPTGNVCSNGLSTIEPQAVPYKLNNKCGLQSPNRPSKTGSCNYVASDGNIRRLCLCQQGKWTATGLT